MVSDASVALLFLSYLLAPLLLLFVWWLAGWFRRKVLKKGETEDEAGEADA